VSTASYRERAELYKPQTIDEARAAAHRMLDEGYSDHGIAAALGVAIEEVRRMLAERGVGAT
jgi:transposase-like protein